MLTSRGWARVVGDAGLWLLRYTQGAEFGILRGEGYQKGCEGSGWWAPWQLSHLLLAIPSRTHLALLEGPGGREGGKHRTLHVFQVAISCRGI